MAKRSLEKQRIIKQLKKSAAALGMRFKEVSRDSLNQSNYALIDIDGITEIRRDTQENWIHTFKTWSGDL